MTQSDIDNGNVNISVGFASLKPAEFVIIRSGSSPPNSLRFHDTARHRPAGELLRTFVSLRSSLAAELRMILRHPMMRRTAR